VKEEDIHTLIAEVLSGKTTSFASIVDRHKDMVQSVALKITHDQELSEEVSQDTFMKAFKSLASFKKKSKFSTWLYQITYFTAINALRKNKLDTIELSYEHENTSKENGFESLEKQERSALIERSLAFLKPDDRAVIVLFYLKELSTEEVAEITKLTVANVKVKVHRAKKKLYTVLEGILQNEFNTIKHED
jgi:RNA polymerase sigma factor (sigma-70 family)